MPKIGESLLRLAVRITHQSGKNTSSNASLNDVHNYVDYIRWQYESSSRLFALYPDFDPRGKEILEIGCGTGGRAAYLASCGAKRVVGIDINGEEIAVAKRQCAELFPETNSNLEFHTSGEDRPLDIGQFDLVILVDCMEHVVSPPAMMRLAYDYTKPSGKCYFSCIGYYHHRGSHMGLIPFANVFFSDETILNVMRWWVQQPSFVPSRFDSNPPIERWRGIYDLRDRPGERLNKLTIRDMKRLVKYSIFPRARIKVVGLGGAKRLLAPFSLLKNVPLVQEVFHSYVIAEFQKCE